MCRALQLPNGLRVLLISDPNISESVPELDTSKGVDNMAYSSAGESDEDELEEKDGNDESEEDGEEEESESETEEDSEVEPESTESNGIDSCKKSKHANREGERMAAAALCVNVGSFSDPSDLPGLAHFLEHMVFMGSSKYPEENAFDEYLKVIPSFYVAVDYKSLSSFSLRHTVEVQTLQLITKPRRLSLKFTSATFTRH